MPNIFRGMAARRNRAGLPVRQDMTEAQLRLQRRQRMRLLARALLVAAVMLGASHVLTHLGALMLIPNQGLADLVIGYPSAALLGLLGLMLLPAERY